MSSFATSDLKRGTTCFPMASHLGFIALQTITLFIIIKLFSLALNHPEQISLNNYAPDPASSGNQHGRVNLQKI